LEFKTTILIIFTKKPVKIHLNKKKSSAAAQPAQACAGSALGPAQALLKMSAPLRCAASAAQRRSSADVAAPCTPIPGSTHQC